MESTRPPAGNWKEPEMSRDKTQIDPNTAKRAKVALAREVVKRADREISLRPAATVAPLVRDMRNLILTYITDTEAQIAEQPSQ